MSCRELEGKTVVVTGGAGGLGTAIARTLEERGAATISFDLQAPTRGDFRIVDLTSGYAVKSAVEDVLNARGSIDILVNCAGFAKHEPLEEISFGSWHEVVDANLTAAFLTTQQVAPHMRDNGWGRVINIGSEQAMQGDPDLCHYAAAKAGLISLTKSFALAYAPNVNINLVSPGPTETEKFRKGPHFDPDVMSAIPLQRFGRPLDVALSVAFLAGSGGDYYTGQQLDPNGGADLPARASVGRPYLEKRFDQPNER